MDDGGGGRSGKRRREGRMTRKGKKGQGGVDGREYLISKARGKGEGESYGMS
jgi:hypothetical protein